MILGVIASQNQNQAQASQAAKPKQPSPSSQAQAAKPKPASQANQPSQASSAPSVALGAHILYFSTQDLPRIYPVSTQDSWLLAG